VEVEQWRGRAEQAERELALRRAVQEVDWFDAEDAFRELSRRAERDASGNWQIVMSRRGGESKRLTPSEATRELAQRKPHWVRARVLGGTGAGGGTSVPVGSSVSYAELLRPENAARLQEYVHDRPEELERLRQAHFNGK
jgi:hypothetical protein